AGLPAGSFFIAAENASQLRLAVDSLGVGPVAVNTVPPDMHAIRPRRIALFDYYGGSMSSGWVRWLLGQTRVASLTVVDPKAIDQGNLIDDYDIILFIGNGIPPAGNHGSSRRGNAADRENIPAAYHHMLGNITATHSIPQLKKFAEAGGTLFT